MSRIISPIEIAKAQESIEIETKYSLIKESHTRVQNPIHMNIRCSSPKYMCNKYECCIFPNIFDSGHIGISIDKYQLSSSF